MRPNRLADTSRLEAEFQPSCAWVRARLFDYLDGELERPKAQALESHLQACVSCRSEVESCRRSETALTSALRAVPPVEDMRAEFYRRLASELPSRRQSLRRIAVPTFAIVAAALLGFVWIRFGPGTPSSQAFAPGSEAKTALSVLKPPPAIPGEFKRAALPGKKSDNERVASAADAGAHSERRRERLPRSLVSGVSGTKRRVRFASASWLRHRPALFAANVSGKTRRRKVKTTLPLLVAAKAPANSLPDKGAAAVTALRDGSLSPKPVSLALLNKQNMPAVTAASLPNQADQDEVDLHVQDEVRGFSTTTRVAGRVREAGGEQVLTIDADGTLPEEP